jgi:DNA-binding transcriptional LysR family regulator
MSRSEISLRQIEVLRAVIRCETTVRAAAELGMTQPAVSNAIRHLEGQLGFPMFERVNNRLFPTSEARVLNAEAEPLFAAHSRIQAVAKSFQGDHCGTLRLVATAPLGYSVVPTALKSFRKAFPTTKVFMNMKPEYEVVDLVDSGVDEIGFVLGSKVNRDLHVEEIFSESIVAIMRPEHPLAAEPEIRPEHFAGERFVSLGEGTQVGDLTRSAFAEREVPFQPDIEVRYCNSACILVENGLGLSIVDPLTPAYSGRYDLITRPFRPQRMIAASMLHSPKRMLSKSAKAFLKEIRLASAMI